MPLECLPAEVWRASCLEIAMARTVQSESPAWRRALYHLRELTAQNAASEGHDRPPFLGAPHRPGQGEVAPSLGLDETELDELDFDTLHDFDSRP